ncbi:hypothetical protein [uncultured Intestinimonas sp.]|uniref:hypothetical protein n=1 Tax=uncultured Intestinimonas sp. TaxID=1689265 RepID=UPI00260A3A8F|nr:hypothetical protein [uncultured Intestinimonas sp.]
MKKTFLLCCISCLLALGGCRGETPEVSPAPGPEETVLPTVAASPTATQPPATETAAEVPLPTDTAVLPDDQSPSPAPSPSDTTSAPEVSPSQVTEAEPRPAWDGDVDGLSLTDFPTQLSTGGQILERVSSLGEGEGDLSLVSQLPDQDTWLYGAYAPDGTQGLILRVGRQWKYFAAPYLTQQGQVPAMLYGDFDKDGAQELAVVSQQEGGPDVSRWGLYVADFSEDSWTILEFSPADYTAILDLSISSAYDPETNTVVLQAGEDTVSLALSELGISSPGGEIIHQTGGLILFTAEGDTLYGTFSVSLDAPAFSGYAALDDVALARAEVVYTGSAFGLNGLALLPSEVTRDVVISE